MPTSIGKFMPKAKPFFLNKSLESLYGSVVGV